MSIWQWLLIVLSVLSLGLFVFMLLRYLSLKKKALAVDVIRKDTIIQQDDSLQTPSTEETSQWLALLKQQQYICTQLTEELPKSDFQGRAALSCWAIFLEIEIHIIEQSIPHSDVVGLLDAFKGILEKVDRAQEIDDLLKSLKVNQSLLSELNKVIQKTGDKVFAQVNITSELNAQLSMLQSQLATEAELDESLAALRAQMASMCEFVERLKLHLAEVKQEGDSALYVEAIETFLEGTDQSVFLDSVRSELHDKVSDLKQLAAHQKAIMVELKEQIRKARAGHEGDSKHVGVYDIYIVRLEKALLESSRVVKRLEKKLESLQTIKYNLNIDVIKRDEALKQKHAQLQKKDVNTPQNTDIYDVFDEERSTMKNMEDLLYQDSFTEESDSFASEQASKLSSLRQMVNESELYVEMLERDLDKARALRESLENKLLHPELIEDAADNDADVMASQDLEEFENLKEVNAELEEERKRLEAALYDGQVQAAEFIKLQKKIEELDDKIALTQKNYVEMEERYVAALMAKGADT
ncbi:hypothetical protein [Marinomonas shanghaiensis]|uniref:hypothetical protein n=1 Tax=Marinomonas shanghaiensis TaxID=2202418 RepID=UPI003A91605E